MDELRYRYDLAKKKANLFMKNGQINDYFLALMEMRRYKKLMRSVIAN